MDRLVAGDAWVIRVGAVVGVDANRSQRGYFSPLASAAESGNRDAVEYFLRHGADPNRREKLGATPLALASRYGRVDIARILLDAGAIAGQSGEYGTPIDVASRYCDAEMVALLRAHGAALSLGALEEVARSECPELAR